MTGRKGKRYNDPEIRVLNEAVTSEIYKPGGNIKNDYKNQSPGRPGLLFSKNNQSKKITRRASKLF